MSVLLSWHPQKQVLARDVDLPYQSELLLGVISGLSVPSEVDLDTPAGKQAAQELVREIKRRIKAVVVDHARLQDDIHQLQRVWDEVVTDAHLDKLKQRGFYVDFSEDRTGMVTPQDLGSTEFREAESVFEQARRSLDVLAVNGLTPEVIQTFRDLAAEDE